MHSKRQINQSGASACTWFRFRLDPAPGTWGTLVGLLIGWLLLQWIAVPFFLIFALIAFFIGCYLCENSARYESARSQFYRMG